MNRNGFGNHNQPRPPGLSPTNVPILGQRPANPQRWRCAKSHEYAGDPPEMTLPVGTENVAVVRGVCVICVLEHLEALFPVTEVTDEAGEQGAAPKGE